MRLDNGAEVVYDKENNELTISRIVDWAIMTVTAHPKSVNSVFLFIQAYSYMSDDEFKAVASITDC